jgi:hypothetical protein
LGVFGPKYFSVGHPKITSFLGVALNGSSPDFGCPRKVFHAWLIYSPASMIVHT